MKRFFKLNSWVIAEKLDVVLVAVEDIALNRWVDNMHHIGEVLKVDNHGEKRKITLLQMSGYKLDSSLE